MLSISQLTSGNYSRNYPTDCLIVEFSFKCHFFRDVKNAKRCFFRNTDTKKGVFFAIEVKLNFLSTLCVLDNES